MWPPPKAVVMGWALRNTGVHTFLGMLGYCMKDANAAHYQSVNHNVSAVDLVTGEELYTQYGSKDKNNRVCLNQPNTLERATMFW